MAEAQSAKERQDALKKECGQRIRAVLDEATQLNLQGAALAEVLDGAEMAAFRAAQDWIGAMRAACRWAVSQGAAPDWPEPPAAAAALAARF